MARLAISTLEHHPPNTLGERVDIFILPQDKFVLAAWRLIFNEFQNLSPQ